MGRGLEVEGQEVARQEQKSWEVGQGQELGGLGRGLRASSIGPSDSMNHVVCPVCTLLGVGTHSGGTLPMPAPDRPPALSAPGNQRMTLVQPGATSLKVLSPTLSVHGQLSRVGVG